MQAQGAVDFHLEVDENNKPEKGSWIDKPGPKPLMILPRRFLLGATLVSKIDRPTMCVDPNVLLPVEKKMLQELDGTIEL